MRRLLLIIGVVVLFLAFLAWSVGMSTARRGLDAFDADRLTEAQLERYIEDQRQLTALDLVPTTRGTRDAGVVLNRWVSLDGGTDAEQMADEAAWWAAPEVREALKCKDAGDKEPLWLACAHHAPRGDLSFMGSLLAYDTWDPSSSGAWPRYLAAHPTELPWAVAIPNYVPLQTLVKLRLIAGLEEPSPLPALTEVRQLARLTWSTETLVGAMVAVAMLNMERAAYEEAVARGALAPELWRPMSEAEGAALKRVLWTTYGLYLGKGPPDAIARLHAAVPAPLGLCPGGAEAALFARLTRALFTDPWPGEIDRSAWIAPLDARMRDGRCRDVYIGALWSDRTRDLDIIDATAAFMEEPGEAPGTRWERVAARIPWVRQGAGGVLLGVALPDLNRYDE